MSAEWGVLGAHHAGAPHKRDRIWILAYASEKRRNKGADDSREKRKEARGSKPGLGSETLGDTIGEGLEGYSRDESDRDKPRWDDQETYRSVSPASIRWWDEDPADRESKPRLDRMASRISDRVDRIKAIGNSQVPAVVALAWQTLYDRIW